MNIEKIETSVSSKIEKNLRAAEACLSSQRVANARALLNSVASANRELARLHKRRRGEPREALALKIRYYGAWQVAAVGAFEVARGHTAVGTTLLQIARECANELVHTNSDSTEYTTLLEKVKTWQNM